MTRSYLLILLFSFICFGKTTTDSSKAKVFEFDTTGAVSALKADMTFDEAGRCISVALGNNVVWNGGQENYIHVRNQTGSTITNGSVVYLSGSTGDNPTISLASASNPSNSMATIGIATEDILNGYNGLVTTFGMVHDRNTSAYTTGNVVFLSTTPGVFSQTAPAKGNRTVMVGVIVRSHASEGIICVCVTKFPFLSELPDVDTTGRVTNSILTLNSSGIWVPTTAPTFSNVAISPLTTYYMPYKAASGYLANGPFFTNGTNAALGKNSVEAWGGAFKALQIGGTMAFMAGATESAQDAMMLNNCYFDGAWKPMVTNGVGQYRIKYDGTHAWYSNVGTTGDASFTPTLRMALDSLGNLSVTNKVTSTRDSTQDVVATDTVKGGAIVGGTVSGTTGTFSGAVAGDTLTITKGIKLGTGATGSTATPYSINLGKTYSDGSVASKCKMFVYNDGANELYGMSIGPQSDLQYHAHSSVSTSTHRFYVNDVEKFRVNNTGVDVTGSLNTDSITTNGTDYIKYSTGTFPCSLFDASTYRSYVTAKYSIIGKSVTITIPYIRNTVSGGPVYLKTLPSEIRPITDKVFSCIVSVGSDYTITSGFITISPIGRISLYKSDGHHLDSGTIAGLANVSNNEYSFTYNLD